MAEQRTDYMYYARALAIIGMVYKHVGFSVLKYVGLFAMPLFFFQSGWFYKPGKKTLKQETIDSFKKLMIPFYGFMALYAVIGTIRAMYFGYGGVNGFLCDLVNTIWGSGYVPVFTETFHKLLDAGRTFVSPMAYTMDSISPVNCHLWFLPAMFTGRILLCAILPHAKKPASRVLWICVLVALAAGESILLTDYQVFQLPLGLGRGFIAAAWMLAGYWLREKGLFTKHNFKMNLAIFVLSFAVAFTSVKLGSTGGSMVMSYYGPYGVFSVYLTYVGGLGAIIVVLYLCKLLEKVQAGFVQNILVSIGKNSMSVYLWHLAVKAVMDILYSLIKGGVVSLDSYKVSLLTSQAFWYMLLEGAVCIALCTYFGMRKSRKAVK